jgi:hypothetical protein
MLKIHATMKRIYKLTVLFRDIILNKTVHHHNFMGASSDSILNSILLPSNLYLSRYYFKKSVPRKLHNEEVHNLYSSPSIIRIIKSRRMRWAGHVARMGEKRNVCMGYW